MNKKTTMFAPALLMAALAAGSASATPCGGTYAYTGALVSCEVDQAGTYLLDAFGAQGGSGTSPFSGPTTGGLGAHAAGKVTLSVGDKLWILVGGRGGTGGSGGGGGGGGSFIVMDPISGALALAVAGGGGGAGAAAAGLAGRSQSSGGAGSSRSLTVGGAGGTDGAGGAAAFVILTNTAAGGGGLLTSGSNGGFRATGGASFLLGGAGGNGGIAAGSGGFGGGGGGYSGDGGGGGGYSGGGGGISGGGGGSFLAASVIDDILEAGVRSGDGLVTITFLAPEVTTPAPASLALLGAGLAFLGLHRRRNG